MREASHLHRMDDARNDIDCAHCDAIIRAAEIRKDGNAMIALAIEGAVTKLNPLITSTSELAMRVNLLCRFMRRWTVPLLIGVALSGAATPEMARGLHNVLTLLGADR